MSSNRITLERNRLCFNVSGPAEGRYLLRGGDEAVYRQADVGPEGQRPNTEPHRHASQ